MKRTVQAPIVAFLALGAGSGLANAQGVLGPAFALELESDGTLLIGGEFANATGEDGTVIAGRIVRWDPETERFSALPGGDFPNGRINTLALEPSTGDLLVGGVFSLITVPENDDLDVLNVALYDFDIDEWIAMGEGVTGEVLEIVSDPFGESVIAGRFVNMIQNGSPVRVNRLACWDGNTLEAFISNTNINVAPSDNVGLPRATDVRAVLLEDDGGVLLGGDFGNATSLSYLPQGECVGFPLSFLHDLARLSGNAYSSPCEQDPASQCSEFSTNPGGEYSGGFLEDIALVGGDIYLAGSFQTASCSFAPFPGFVNGVARLSNGTIEPLTDSETLLSGMSGVVDFSDLAVTEIEPGPADLVFFAGEFGRAGGLLADSIAAWNRSTSLWIPLTDTETEIAGVFDSFAGDAGEIHDLAYDAGRNRLYVAGQFGLAGGRTAFNVAYFDIDTSTWHPLEHRASALCLGDCDANGLVDFNDLVSMLFEFGANPGDGCDADESGVVDFNDLVAALFLFGPCP